ncbi:tRNA lysidine(34) synthetase TilS [Pseudomonas sp. GOM7]|uniref:tRNA lysidine(34) synthetase TilS n=1 Tax=Pseudomonas sp. GOM7 TaxID=2998079 RepID=UPI00227C5B28|nr:tRNA lysidine(34) synthetase TilS [Pseudomonas sp. GOM7]WAJ39049.1 tRNA lysidine(34) synthetase TilS [Pseudomonas sp. GOM7]
MTALDLRLRQALQPWRTAPAWYIAFSGGLDSSVLLHLLADWARHETLPPLRALHVEHGLQPAAQAWPAHCAEVCQRLGIELEVLRVRVEAGASLEQAARQARYAAFAQCLEPGALLLTGQHRDDQAETLLLRLLRGAGVRGLAAMPRQRPLGAGSLLRPLLDCPRGELEAYAAAHGLSWVEDPSNRSEQFSRNFLRRQILPRLAERWPQTSAALARTAAHLGEAQMLLDELAEQDLAAVRQASGIAWLPVPSLPLAPIAALSEARQRNLLRHWLAPLTRLPDSEHWAGWRDLRDAGVDATPIWRLTDGELQRSEGRIWWLAGAWLQPPPALDMPWPVGAQEVSLPGNGLLRLRGVQVHENLRVRYRQGGERLFIEGRGQRDLKRLLNEQGVPSFVRGRLPLLYAGDELLVVANLDLPGTAAQSLQWLAPGQLSEEQRAMIEV